MCSPPAPNGNICISINARLVVEGEELTRGDNAAVCWRSLIAEACVVLVLIILLTDVFELVVKVFEIVEIVLVIF